MVWWIARRAGPPTPPRRPGWRRRARRSTQPTPATGKGAGSGDPLIGDLRRAGLLPLLVLHFAAREPAYGNQLIDRIEALTGGALHVNPNTMYPLLRSLEAQGLVAGEWEHPERRSRRFYRATDDGPRGAAAGCPASSARGWTGSPPRSTRSATELASLMGRAKASISVPGRAAEAEALWYDPHRWQAWVDGFGHVVSLDGDWPRRGAELVWQSPPGGRGRVTERVVAYEMRIGPDASRSRTPR